MRAARSWYSACIAFLSAKSDSCQGKRVPAVDAFRSLILLYAFLVSAGIPAYAGVPCKSLSGGVADRIDGWIEAAPAGADEILVTIPAKYLTSSDQTNANLARVGFVKALFHTSDLPEIGGYTDVSEGHCAVYKVDLKQVWGTDSERKWQIVATPGGIEDPSFDPARQYYVPMSRQETEDLGRRVISAPRLAFNLTYPANYVQLVNSPETVRELRSSRDLAIGGYNNGIPCGPRLLAVRTIEYKGMQRIFFISGDPSNSRTNEAGTELPASPPGSRHQGSYSRNGYAGNSIPRISGRQISGSEAYHQLPNGLLRYFVFRNPGSIGTKALASGVIDPVNARNGFHLVTGRSCIGCHNNGVRGAPMDTYDKGNGWDTRDIWEPYFTKARDEFRQAMQTIVASVSSASDQFNERLSLGSTREPVAFLIGEMEGSPSSNSRRRGSYGPSRPYSRCQIDGVDKFQKQVSDMKMQLSREASDKDGAPPPPVTGDTGTETNGPAATPGAGSAGGAPAVFMAQCGQSGCHNLPQQDERLSRAVPQMMWFIAGKNPLDPQSPKAKEIRQWLANRNQDPAPPATTPPGNDGGGPEDPVADTDGKDTDKSPGPAGPAAAGSAAGARLFQDNCGRCHGDPAMDSRLSRPVPERMWSMAGLDSGSADAGAIRAWLKSQGGS